MVVYQGTDCQDHWHFVFPYITLAAFLRERCHRDESILTSRIRTHLQNGCLKRKTKRKNCSSAQEDQDRDVAFTSTSMNSVLELKQARVDDKGKIYRLILLFQTVVLISVISSTHKNTWPEFNFTHAR